MIRTVRLGTPRSPGEGLRIGTVRRPPRGVPKAEHASGNWYDAWLPELAPSPGLVTEGLSAQTPVAWRRFERAYRREMAVPAAARTIALLAALSHRTELAVGCYCADAARCHRSVLRELLAEAGAAVDPASS